MAESPNCFKSSAPKLNSLKCRCRPLLSRLRITLLMRSLLTVELSNPMTVRIISQRSCAVSRHFITPALASATRYSSAISVQMNLLSLWSRYMRCILDSVASARPSKKRKLLHKQGAVWEIDGWKPAQALGNSNSLLTFALPSERHG